MAADGVAAGRVEELCDLLSRNAAAKLPAGKKLEPHLLKEATITLRTTVLCDFDLNKQASHKSKQFYVFDQFDNTQ